LAVAAAVAFMHIFPTTIITEPPRFRSQRELIFDRHCGDGWAGTYSHIHAAALTANPPRLLRVHPRGGLGNNLDAIVTMFYWAILSNRALVIMPKADVPFEAVFDSKYINWTDDGARAASPASRFIDLRFAEWMADDASDVFEALHARNLTEIYADTPILDIALGAPLFHVIFTNPHHRAQLFTWGLSPETAFGCALNYLFMPNLRLRTRFADEFARLADGAVLKIGIHARFGDAVFLGNSTDKANAVFDDKHLAHIFHCAQEIEDLKAVAEQEVLWYVVSDAEQFRHYAIRRFGNKVYARTNESIVNLEVWNPERSQEWRPDHDISLDSKVHAFEMVVAEYWLYAMADFHVMALPFGPPTPQYATSSFSNGAASASLR
jgi:hypothetical protein